MPHFTSLLRRIILSKLFKWIAVFVSPNLLKPLKYRVQFFLFVAGVCSSVCFGGLGTRNHAFLFLFLRTEKQIVNSCTVTLA